MSNSERYTVGVVLVIACFALLIADGVAVWLNEMDTKRWFVAAFLAFVAAVMAGVGTEFMKELED